MNIIFAQLSSSSADSQDGRRLSSILVRRVGVPGVRDALDAMFEGIRDAAKNGLLRVLDELLPHPLGTVDLKQIDDLSDNAPSPLVPSRFRGSIYSVEGLLQILTSLETELEFSGEQAFLLSVDNLKELRAVRKS